MTVFPFLKLWDLCTWAENRLIGNMLHTNVPSGSAYQVIYGCINHIEMEDTSFKGGKRHLSLFD